MKDIKSVGIIGAGNMAEGLIARIGFFKKLIASDKNTTRIDYIKTNYKIDIKMDNRFVVENSEIIILAVKPQDIDGVLDEIKAYLKKRLLVSIAAGVSTSHLEGICGRVRVVRVMPNLACLVGFGVSAITKGRYADSEDIRVVKKLFNLVGEVFEVKESDMDAITAISGSGPAYYFLLTELLKKAGTKLGLKNEMADRLALATLYGSGRLVKETGVLPSLLIEKIASKGGTTEAALAIFKEADFEEIVERAVKAARDRARALSK